MVFATKTVGEAMPVYDAVVIGSGYGGGVAASRLARMGLRLAVLEQGRHWRPGDFPTTAKARRKATRLTGRAPKLGDPAGLYYLSVGKGLTVFGASGLGGGSLINAGVVLRPDLGRLRKAGWPDAVVSDGLLLKGLARAEAMLGVAPVPGPERFAKFAGMRRAAEASGRSVQLPSMTISHSPGPNAAGVMQYACRHCGDCWSGCNVGAKNTVGITYIADAVDHGATVLCESRAQSISKTESGWEIVVQDLSKAGASRRIEAPIVVLAAGTLGTNELLLRAQQRGLELSAKLGEKFSANGDDLVFAEQSRRAGQCRCHGLSTSGATGDRAGRAPQHGADRPRRRAWSRVGSRRHDADRDGRTRSPRGIAATARRGSPPAIESRVSTATS